MGVFSKYDIVVIGGGHAGCEAAAAAAGMGCQTLLVTLAKSKIGEMSCNPAVGGVGKGQLVKEVDALGGLMGEIADQTCIQYRRLNTNRGAAVQSTRMQVDREKYRQAMQRRLACQPGLTILEDEAQDLKLSGNQIQGVVLAQAGLVQAEAVVLAPGTFFHGLIHMGKEKQPGGRIGDLSSDLLPQRLAELGFCFGRFKTGTTPRLDGRSIDFTAFRPQPSDADYIPFSARSAFSPILPQVCCYIGETNLTTHQIIRENLNQSALYSGQITGTGVRYCPSVEDKIVKFPDRTSHHVFLEPEGLDTNQYYPNGLSNSLPLAIQLKLVRSIAGLEQAEIVQTGYGIEHDHVDPTQLHASLESKLINGLFWAGQINGTTGYEEAAAQGILAGINAARRVKKQSLIILDRSQAYLGVLIDDLVTKGTNEPYRMFTSRVEYRLVLREDNADERLTPLGHELGLISDQSFHLFQTKQTAVQQELKRLRKTRLDSKPALEDYLQARGTAPCQDSITLEALLRRSELHYADVLALQPVAAQVSKVIQELVEVQVKYAGYIQQQLRDIEKFRHLESISIPTGFVYQGLPGLSLEVVEKLTQWQPQNLGQASRIAGITPAAISLLIWYLKKRQNKR